MAFPELTSAVRSLVNRTMNGMRSSNGNPVTLDLSAKTPEEQKAIMLSFDTVNVGWYARNGYPGLYYILAGGYPAWSGEPVNLQTALNHSVVWACNKLICESVASLPLMLMRNTEKGKVLATDHPMYDALMYSLPNGEMTAMSFRETRTSHALLTGNGFARIIRRSGTGTAIDLQVLDPAQVSVCREKDGKRRVYYKVDPGDNKPPDTFYIEPNKPQDILHLKGMGFDGLRGFSVINMGRQSIGTAISAERHVARFYANGGRVPYILTMDKKFGSDDQFDKFRSDWESTYSEPHKVPVLENSMKYQQIGLNAVDSQMLQTRLFDIHEICRWFGISPHLVGDLSRATFNNIEQLAMEFVKLTLTTWMRSWEQELRRCVLTPEEQRAGYFFHHDLDDLLRGDFATRVAGYSTLLQNAVVSVNEVRDWEWLNPVTGGDIHHIQLNMQNMTGSALPAAGGSVPLGKPSPSLVPLNKPNESVVALGESEE
jgi:HK97 family phage portal protein